MLNKKLLILETDKDRKLNSQALAREGYQITVVRNVTDAISTAASQPFDLLIVRPEQPELLNMLLAHFPPGIGTLIICPENKLKQTVECAGTGISSFLVEPFTINKFKEAIVTTINKTDMIEEGLRNRVLTSLEQANRLLAGEIEIDRFFNLVAEMSISGTKADYTSVIVKNEATGDYEVKASSGNTNSAYDKICRLAMIKSEPIIIDVATEKNQRLCKQMSGAGISAVMSLPITIRGEIIGASNHVKMTGNGTFTKSDVNFISILNWWTSITLENSRLFKQVEKQTIHVDSLLNEIVSAQQNERKRVAIEIHDGVAQWMVGASFGIKACSTLISESRLTELEVELNKIRETLQKSVRELRRAISNFRPIPLQEIGLIPAICQTTECLNQEGIQCRVETDDELTALSLAEETTAYWIVQEAITNIRKHSTASEVEIKIKSYDNELRIEINDNGRGFNPNIVLSSPLMLEHMGLIGMQERAKLVDGLVSIKSAPGLGTNVVLSIPVSSKKTVETIY
ncbi:MAG: histidine kinase [Dehalococcoidales bacterium]|nr:histidine kinase [Dehalococcoidales bacterium]